MDIISIKYVIIPFHESIPGALQSRTWLNQLKISLINDTVIYSREANSGLNHRLHKLERIQRFQSQAIRVTWRQIKL